MKMTYRWWTPAAIAALLLGLTGCTSWLPIPAPSTGAVAPTADAVISPDRLVGVFLTTIQPDVPGGRLYGTALSDAGWSFNLNGGVGGQAFTVLDTASYAFVNLYAGDSRQQVLFDVHAEAKDTSKDNGDDGTDLSISGTLYLVPDSGQELYWWTNPVYQTPDGRVYLVAAPVAQAWNVSTQMTSLGWNYNESYTTTTLGHTTTENRSVSLTIKPQVVPTSIVMINLSADNKVLSRLEYAPGQVPDSLTPPAGTAYVVVESHGTDGQVTRTIANRGDAGTDTFMTGGSGICLQHTTLLNWS